MILAIDIGNTNIVLGGFEEKRFSLLNASPPIRQPQTWNMLQMSKRH